MQTEQDSTVSMWNKVESELAIDGRYTILGQIGAGGMGQVFKARQVDIDRYVAIKILSADLMGTAEAMQRFHREAKVLSTLEHPNIVRLYHFGLVGDRPYQVVDYLQGVSLSERLVKGPLSINEFGQIFLQMVDALDYASSRDIVHRDIKPGNIFLCNSDDGESIHAVLLDFGIVRQINTNGATLTSTQAVLGSPPYMSPEQCKTGLVDHRSDIYSLGCTMFQALTGAPPFEADNMVEIMLAHMNAPIPELTAYSGRSRVECQLTKIIEQCLEKDPSNRPPSFRDLKDKLVSALDQVPAGVVFVQPVARTAKRAFLNLVLGGVLTVALLGAIGVLTMQRLNQPVEDHEKQLERELLSEIDRKKHSDLIKGLGRELNGNYARQAVNLIQSYEKLGAMYMRQHRYGDAEKILNQALAIMLQNKDIKDEANHIYLDLGKVYLAKADKEVDPNEKKALRMRALEVLSKADNLLKGALLVAVEAGIRKAVLLIELGQFEQARVQVKYLVDNYSTGGSTRMKELCPRVAGGTVSTSFGNQFARDIQEAVQAHKKPLPAADMLKVSEMYLLITEALYEEANSLDNFVSYTREWLDKAYKTDPSIRNSAVAGQLEERWTAVMTKLKKCEAARQF